MCSPRPPSSALPEGARIARVFATGYGRDYIAFADGTRTEISCHGKGANYLYANARCVIDIGGQDSKVICLGEGGEVTNFVMNDKCAAGTGRFLEMMAATLEAPGAEPSGAVLEKRDHDLLRMHRFRRVRGGFPDRAE